MTWFEVLLVIHILATVVWLGGALVGMLIGGRLRRSGDATAMAKFCAAFAEIAGPLFGGSALLVLLTGIGMVTMDGGPDWGEPWIVLGLVGWLVSTVLGATAVGRSWYRVGTTLAEPGATIEASQPLISRAVMYSWIDLLIRTGVVVLMVWRPT